MRLTSLLARIANRNKKREQGATIVLVTISMVALLGMAAVSIDYAVASDQRAKVQAGADATALAMAKHCAVKSPKCNPSTGTAEALWYLNENAPGATGTVTPSPNYNNKRVTVNAEGDSTNTFARVFGDVSTHVGATATATWDSTPVHGTPNVPLAIGFCDWQSRQGTIDTPGSEATYEFGSLQGFTGTSCTGVPQYTGTTVKHPKNKAIWMTSGVIPGFNIFSCEFSPSLWNIYSDVLDMGLDIRPACKQKFEALAVGDVILMPIYAQATFIGLPTSMAIIGFAPMKITGFRKVTFWIPGNSSTCTFSGFDFLGAFACTGIKGRFIRTARPYPGWEYATTYKGRPTTDLGAVKIRLTN